MSTVSIIILCVGLLLIIGFIVLEIIFKCVKLMVGFIIGTVVIMGGGITYSQVNYNKSSNAAITSSSVDYNSTTYNSTTYNSTTYAGGYDCGYTNFEYNSEYDYFTCCLYPSGRFDYVEVCTYKYSDHELLDENIYYNSTITIIEDCKEYYKGLYYTVTPYLNGVRYETMYCYPMKNNFNNYYIVTTDNRLGYINTVKIAGFTEDYITGENRSSDIYVRRELGKDWHVRINRWYYNSTDDIMWMELYDSDDGDYYGWVDYNYITLY